MRTRATIVFLSFVASLAACEAKTPTSDLAGAVAPGGEDLAALAEAGTEADGGSVASNEVADGEDTAATPVDAFVAEVAPGCDPACKAWQDCDPVKHTCKQKACAATTECDDAAHWCVKGTCQAYQCADDGDCGPNAFCENKYQYVCVEKVECTQDIECYTPGVCALYQCQSQKCVAGTKPACCESDAACDDGVACTADSCLFGTCQHDPKPSCCAADTDCDDGDACTADACQGGACAYGPVAGCCKGPFDCDDGLDATLDQCVSGACIHGVAGLPASCGADADCLPNACRTAVCKAGLCSFAPTGAAGCCATDLQCDDAQPCTADTCVGFACTHAAASGQGVYVGWTFDTGAQGWQMSGNSVPVLHISTLSASSPPSSLRYGRPDAGDYDGIGASVSSASSPFITVPKAPATLEFKVKMHVEAGKWPAVTLGLDLGGNAAPVEVWSKESGLKGSATGLWVAQSVDLSAYAGMLVAIVIDVKAGYDSPVEKLKTGVFFDDMRVLGGCP